MLYRILGLTIYKDQVFNSVVINPRDTAGQSKIRLDLEVLNKKYEVLKLKWVENVFYKANIVDYILPIRATTEQQNKFRNKIPGVIGFEGIPLTASQIAQIEFATLTDELFETEKKIIDLEILEKNIIERLALKNFILTSEIVIDTKYQNYYDNGIIVVYLRNPLVESGIWQESVRLIETKDPITGLTASAYVGLNKISKDKVYLQGSSSRIEEALVKAAKFDVKIVFFSCKRCTNNE